MGKMTVVMKAMSKSVLHLLVVRTSFIAIVQSVSPCVGCVTVTLTAWTNLMNLQITVGTQFLLW